MTDNSMINEITIEVRINQLWNKFLTNKDKGQNHWRRTVGIKEKDRQVQRNDRHKMKIPSINHCQTTAICAKEANEFIGKSSNETYTYSCRAPCHER